MHCLKSKPTSRWYGRPNLVKVHDIRPIVPPRRTPNLAFEIEMRPPSGTKTPENSDR
jgi:hypothetical protein